MRLMNMGLLGRFARHGVLHREAVKNDLPALHALLKRGFAQKVIRSGRVFYELTERSLPLLEHLRRRMFEEVQLHLLVEGPSPFFQALLEDVRFLDETRPEAAAFLLLGDWQLTRPVVPAQLELAKLRFYRERVPRRTRRAA